MGLDHNRVTIFAEVSDIASQANSQHKGDGGVEEPIVNQPYFKRIRISPEKFKEILIYKYTIYSAILLELICALVIH